MRDLAQLRKGVVELAVLATLNREATYGGALLETLSTNRALAISPGTLYPLLTRLRQAKLVTITWRESPVGPPRKYYALTAKGKRRLAALTTAFSELTGAITTILEAK